MRTGVSPRFSDAGSLLQVSPSASSILNAIDHIIGENVVFLAFVKHNDT